jgi:hypothetical protein
MELSKKIFKKEENRPRTLWKNVNVGEYQVKQLFLSINN